MAGAAQVQAGGREADFVIVGGGSGGGVLAARLSEDPGARVMLIEAGNRDSSPYIHLPVAYYKTTGPKFTWGFETVPQVHQHGLRAPLAQARVLGGGSSVNAQIYMRGTPSDYDAWRDEFGCHGWGYRDMLPYFVKSEGNARLVGEVHGADGPLLVSDAERPLDLSLAWLRACQEAGLPFNADFNSGDPTGCGFYQVTNRKGRRSSVATCYLKPARNRPNLQILTGSHVSRIRIEGGRAMGVEVNRAGRTEVIRARREVILSAGAIGTPKLLMLSGVGPAGHLRRMGIEVQADAPEVGQNLQDHLDVFMIYELNGPTSYDRYKKLRWQALAGLEFAMFGTGPITSNVLEVGAFWWVDRAEPTPDVQFHFLVGSGVEAAVAGVPSGWGCTLNAYLVRPLSRGQVTLGTTDPMVAPLIDPNYLSHPDDLTKTVASVRLGRQIMRQSALAPFLRREHFPGDDHESEAELEEFVRREARSGYHPSGTCRMGSDERSVVDTELRVRGVDGLRVADASIMPRLVSANTNATTIVVAERAADFIRGNR